MQLQTSKITQSLAAPQTVVLLSKSPQDGMKEKGLHQKSHMKSQVSPMPPILNVWEEITLSLVLLRVRKPCSYLVLVLRLFQLAFVVIYSVIKSPWAKTAKGKTISRVIFNSAIRFITSNASIRQQQKLQGSSFGNYKKWIKSTGYPQMVDKLGKSGRLFWLGPKETDRVLLYCHGEVSFPLLIAMILINL